MLRTRLLFLPALMISIFSLSVILALPSLAQEWTVRGTQQGILKVVDLWLPFDSVWQNYSETLVMLDKGGAKS